MSIEAHLDKIPLFYEIVKQGSIRGAAKNMGMSQPGLSRVVQVLEDAVGARLLLRDHDGVKLTEPGQLLFALADQFKRQIGEFQSELNHGLVIKQKLLIGTYESIAVYFFPEFLKFVAQSQKKLELSLNTAPSSQLIEQLRKSHIDIALSVSPPRAKEIRSTLLFQDEYRLYRHSGASVDSASPLLLFADAQDDRGRKLDWHVEQSQYSKRSQFVSESFESVKAMTLAGLGLGILPFRVAEKSVRTGDLVEHVESKSPPFRVGTHTIAFSYLKHREGDAGITWILNTLQRFERQRGLLR